MTRTTLAPWTWQEAFGFAQGAEVRNTRTVVYVAGQGSVDADGNPVHDGDMEKQVVQALDNVEAVLGEAGLTLADVVKYDVQPAWLFAGNVRSPLPSVLIIPSEYVKALPHLAFGNWNDNVLPSGDQAGRSEEYWFRPLAVRFCTLLPSAFMTAR